MKNLKTQLTVLLLSAFCLSISAHAQITPSADAYTSTVDPTTNYGAATTLGVDGATEATYIQFNLASIPASATVSQATLKLYVNTVTTAGSFNVDYINGTWEESTITSKLAPALGATIVSSVAITTADKNQYMLINITPAVQAWLSGSQANDGLALVANSTFNATFDSKESTTTSHPPELDIVFAGGDGSGLTGITTASGSGLTGGGTSGTLNLSLTKTCSSGQVLEWNGTAWACATPKGSGTVTSVGSGAGLTGGPITGSGTLSISSGGVTNTMLANSSLTVGTGSGLTGGGSVALGGSLSLGLTPYTCPSGLALVELPAVCTAFASNGANTFSGNQATTGNISATGSITGQTGSFSGTSALNSAIVNVTQGGAGNGINATSASGFGLYGSGVYGVYGNSATMYGPGVYGNATAAGGFGVFGIERSTTGTNVGVYGQNNSPTSGVSPTGGAGVNGVSTAEAGTGVLGQAPGSTLSATGQLVSGNGTLGVWGDTAATSGTGVGVLATADDNFAVYAANNSVNPVLAPISASNGSSTGGAVFYGAMPADLAGDAIIGDAGCGAPYMALQLGQTGFGGCLNYTLMGDSSGSTYINATTGNQIAFRINNANGTNSGPAVMNLTGGNVSVYGNLRATGIKSFRIDHPLDPANKYLFHASIESSEVLNLYRGNVTLDGAGEAVIELPDWFEAINKDLSYQLTPIGAPGRDLYIAEEVSGGRFKIAGGKPGGKVSWQVTGVRNDAWAKTHPMSVEVDKGADRGHYLTPQLYGAPESAAIGYMPVPPATEPVVHKRPLLPKRNNVSAPPQPRTLPSIPAPPRPAPPIQPPPHPVAQVQNPEPKK